jgi:5-methylcytosine-specific restriction protein A
MPIGWSNEELAESVRAYLQMQSSHKASEKYSKKAVYEQLAERFGRTTKAFEYRMQNISHVLSAMGREWIPGLKPAKNLGNKIASFLEQQILIQEGVDPKTTKLIFPSDGLVRDFDRAEDGRFAWPFKEGLTEEDIGLTPADMAEWDTQAAQLSKATEKPTAPPPKGTARPKETWSNRKEFVRDLAVIEWVLARANEVCESCLKQAPFKRNDGTPFLEVHHLKQLADQGSDRVSNAVAVCPNCHRELHFGSDAAKLLSGMYRRIAELEPE